MLVVSLWRKWRTKKLIYALTHDVIVKLTIFQGTVQEERLLLLSPPPDTPFGRNSVGSTGRRTDVWLCACVCVCMWGVGWGEYKSSTETASDVTNLRHPYKTLIFIRQWNDDAYNCPSACTIMERLWCDSCNFHLCGIILYSLSLSKNILHEYVKWIKQAHCRVYCRTLFMIGIYFGVKQQHTCFWTAEGKFWSLDLFNDTSLSAEFKERRLSDLNDEWDSMWTEVALVNTKLLFLP
jgi:hypothetical protein